MLDKCNRNRKPKMELLRKTKIERLKRMFMDVVEATAVNEEDATDMRWKYLM